MNLQELTFDKLNDPEAYDQVCSLIRAVIVRHFSYLPASEKEDAFSEGLLKVVLLLKDGKFDPARSSMKNYLYTGIRNEITNYLYRKRKEISKSDEDMINLAIVAPDEFIASIHTSDILSVLKKFGTRKLGYFNRIAQFLQTMGFEIQGEVPSITETISIDEATLEKLICLVIWRR